MDRYLPEKVIQLVSNYINLYLEMFTNLIVSSVVIVLALNLQLKNIHIQII